MTNRRNTIQKDLVKNAVYEMKRHVTANDLLFLQNKKCTNCREMNTMRGLSRKLYLDLSVPTEEDQRSDQQRILEALSAEGVKEEVHIPVRMLRQLYPLLDRAGWKITVSLSWNGEKWELVDIESGDTARQHYGLAVDLGSTTVVVRYWEKRAALINRFSGEPIFYHVFFSAKMTGKNWKRYGLLQLSLL